MLGLTTSTQRRDRLSRLIYYYLGDIAYTINERDAREGRGIIQAQVVARVTNFQYDYASRADFDPMLQALMSDGQRTQLIVDDIVAEMERDPQPILVLSGGEEQDEILKAELGRRGIEVISYGKIPVEPAEEDEEEAEMETVRICLGNGSPAVCFYGC